MKMRTMELTVGAFVFLGILSLLMLAIQVSGLGNLFKEERGYKVHADFTNVGALKNRAKVSIGGVVVGRVVNIDLEPNTFNARVTFKIYPSRIALLPSDSRASIMTAGLLGDSFISITPGFDDAFPLKEGSIIPVENTDSAIAFEQLISKFVAGQATASSSSSNQSSSSPTFTQQTAEQTANQTATQITDQNKAPTDVSKTADVLNPNPNKVSNQILNENASIIGPILPMKEEEALMSKAGEKK